MEYKYVFPAEGPIRTPKREYRCPGGAVWNTEIFVFYVGSHAYPQT